MSARAMGIVGYAMGDVQAYAHLLEPLQQAMASVLRGEVQAVVICRQHPEGGVIIEECGDIDTPPMCYAIEQYSLSLRLDQLTGFDEEDADD